MDQLDQETTNAVLAFVKAKSWDESKRIVEAQQHVLLTDAADHVFTDLLDQYKDDANTIKVLTLHRDILRRARTDGIDAAFAKIHHQPDPATYQFLLQALQATADSNGDPQHVYPLLHANLDKLTPALAAIRTLCISAGNELPRVVNLFSAIRTPQPTDIERTKIKAMTQLNTATTTGQVPAYVTNLGTQLLIIQGRGGTGKTATLLRLVHLLYHIPNRPGTGADCTV